jgi:hypothetical protein
VNFADKELFGFYGGELLAQDEFQVAEHPELALVREKLLETKNSTKCVNEANWPTPFLISGVHRHIELDQSLYGHAFNETSTAKLDKLTKKISPPIKSNIIAMVAPKGKAGKEYEVGEYSSILNTAWTAFLGARLETYYQSQKKEPVIIHTGAWGTGAFGGNKVVMAWMQMIAAHFGWVDTLVYHVMDDESEKAFDEAFKIFIATRGQMKGKSFREVYSLIAGYRFKWGVGNGT